MVDINLGRIIPRPRGNYSSSVVYEELDEVLYNGLVYRVKKNMFPPVGTTPTNTIFWLQTNYRSSQESVAHERIPINNLRSYKMAIAPFNKIVIEASLKLTANSLMVFDISDAGTISFPSDDDSTYTSLYSANDNYSEIFISIEMPFFAEANTKTKVFIRGVGLDGATKVLLDSVLVANTAGVTNAFNILVLNSVRMTGVLDIKKYTYG